MKNSGAGGRAGKGVSRNTNRFMSPTHAECGWCHETLALEEFPLSPSSVNGRRTYCNTCAPIQRKAAQLRRTYNITIQEYDEQLHHQGKTCGICGRPERAVDRGKVRLLSVDHCHTTGAVRGLLCGTCNAALGFMNDDPDLLRAAIKYLNDWQYYNLYKSACVNQTEESA